MKICPTVIEILTLNKWSLNFTVSRSVQLTDVSIDVNIGKTKTNKMVFSTEDLVLIKVLRQAKGYDN